MKNKLNGVEQLEKREVFAVSGFVGGGGTLFLIGNGAADNIEVDQTAPGTALTVLVEGVNFNSSIKGNLSSANKIFISGGGGDDVINNNTYLNSSIYGGEGHDIIQGGGGSDIMFGENGNDIITNFVTDANYVPIGVGTTDLLSGGPGNDSLWGGWGLSDTLVGGAGNDTMYDIVGGINVFDGGDGSDWIIGRNGAGLATDVLNNPGVLTADDVVPDVNDKNVVGFDAATQANGPVLIGTTLYVLNLGSGNITVDRRLVGSLSTVEVNYNGAIFSFPAGSVNTIAGIGGGNSDYFQNNTNIKSVFYGQGGSDTLIGGSNDDVLKGGNGDDYLNGRSGNDDTTGDAGTDTIVANGTYSGRDIVRFDGLDLIFFEMGVDRLVKKNLVF